MTPEQQKQYEEYQRQKQLQQSQSSVGGIGNAIGTAGGYYGAQSLMSGGTAEALTAGVAQSIPAGAAVPAGYTAVGSAANGGVMIAPTSSIGGAPASFGSVAGPALALAAPAAIAYGMGMFQGRGHGYLGNDREYGVDRAPGWKNLDQAHKDQTFEMARKAGIGWTAKDEIDPTNPLAKDGRDVKHFNFTKYLKPSTGPGAGGGGQALGDAKSIAIQRGTYIPTIEEIQNSPYATGEKKAELIAILKSMQEPSAATTASATPAKGAPAAVTAVKQYPRGVTAPAAPSAPSAMPVRDNSLANNDKWLNALPPQNIIPSKLTPNGQKAVLPDDLSHLLNGLTHQQGASPAGWNQAPLPNNNMANAMTNVYQQNRSQTRSPGIDKNGNRINYSRR